MTIAIFGSPYPEHFSKYIQHLIKKLESEHIKIIVEEINKINKTDNLKIICLSEYDSLNI
mgnify:CR=1 FL=1